MLRKQQTRRAFAIFSVVLVIATVIRADQPSENRTVAWMLSRTVNIGGCSGVVLPPIEDSHGKKHWFVASAAHCANASGEYQAEFAYPSKDKRSVSGKHVYRRRGNRRPDMTDILLIEIFPHEDIPYAEIAPPLAPQNGDQVFVTGYPAVQGSQKPLWKRAAINLIRDGVIGIDDLIWQGNSGGPLWLPSAGGPQVIGTGSTSDFQSSAHFSDLKSIHEAYHFAQHRVIPNFICPHGENCPIHGGKGKREDDPGGRYQQPPDEDLVAMQQQIDALTAKITEMESQPPSPPGRDGEDGQPGPGPTREQLQDIAEMVWQKVRDNPEKFKGKDGKDGKDGLDGVPGLPGVPGTVNVVVEWEDKSIIGRQAAAQSGGTVIVTLSKQILERR